MIHTTIGIYANGDRKINGVTHDNLVSHVQYNLFMRPGRAFFVDGVCLNTGYLGYARCKEIERELKTEPVKMDKDTAPYV